MEPTAKPGISFFISRDMPSVMNVKRTGEQGDPCGTPDWSVKGVLWDPPILMRRVGGALLVVDSPYIVAHLGAVAQGAHRFGEVVP